jgi:peptidoglycan/LPS O-acetylase OafA/YrhL
VRIARGGWLDMLRFAAGALIILYHFREAAPLPLGQIHPVFDRGFLLTDFFIIDSGYVLARIYGERLASGGMDVGAYARQRLLRVFPAHLVVVAGLAALVAAAALAGIQPSNPQWFDWAQLPAQALLVQAYGVPGGVGWNAPTWTLSALIGCYLLLPWICRALWSRPWITAAAAVGLLLAADLASRVWLGDPRLSSAAAFRLFARFSAVPAWGRRRGGRRAPLHPAGRGRRLGTGRLRRADARSGPRSFWPSLAVADDGHHLGRRRRSCAQAVAPDRTSGADVVLDVPHQ